MKDKGREASDWLGKLRQNRWLVGFVLILVVMLAVVLAILLIGRGKDSPEVEGAINEAREATETGNYESAYNDLKQAENRAASSSQKAELYGELAAAAANLGNTQEAIDYFKKKHELDPDSAPADAFMLATLFHDLGDINQALDNYRQAVEYYRSLDDEFSEARAASTEAIIAELEAGDE